MQVWHIPLQPDAAALERAGTWLDSAETARAAAFRKDVHRHRFVAAHGAMRAILGNALGCAPQAVVLGATGSGKPVLAGAGAASGLHFNLSHSGDVALLALSPGREVGIDVECYDPADARALEVVPQFSPAEQAALRAFDGAQRVLAFYRCWVRKEALLKATGAGIAAGLARFTVSVDAQARLLASDLPQLSAGDWSLVALDAPPCRVAALAVSGGAPAIEQRDWVWRREHG